MREVGFFCIVALRVNARVGGISGVFVGGTRKILRDSAFPSGPDGLVVRENLWCCNDRLATRQRSNGLRREPANRKVNQLSSKE